MKYTVTVSVVIPFYSNVDWLKEAVLSVLSQSFSDYEIIIVNDGSHENLNDFLNEFGSKIIYKYKENGGPASARNLGIELAQGKYVAFLDSDDLWHNDKLKIQVERMEKTSAVWSHTNWETFKNNKKENVKKRYLSDCHGKIFPRSMISTLILTSCVMIRPDAIKKRSDLRFCESMRFSQDYYFVAFDVLRI
jgi:glycosyltransferase involved in cell wall biosynthesis